MYKEQQYLFDIIMYQKNIFGYSINENRKNKFYLLFISELQISLFTLLICASFSLMILRS